MFTYSCVHVHICIKAYLLRSLSLRQGGILGLVYMAVSTDVTRGVSGVGGGPCECLLNVALPPIPPHLYFGFYGCRLQTDDEKMCFLVFIAYFVTLLSFLCFFPRILFLQMACFFRAVQTSPSSSPSFASGMRGPLTLWRSWLPFRCSGRARSPSGAYEMDCCDITKIHRSSLRNWTVIISHERTPILPL